MPWPNRREGLHFAPTGRCQGKSKKRLKCTHTHGTRTPSLQLQFCPNPPAESLGSVCGGAGSWFHRAAEKRVRAADLGANTRAALKPRIVFVHETLAVRAAPRPGARPPREHPPHALHRETASGPPGLSSKASSVRRSRTAISILGPSGCCRSSRSGCPTACLSLTLHLLHL